VSRAVAELAKSREEDQRELHVKFDQILEINVSPVPTPMYKDSETNNRGMTR